MYVHEGGRELLCRRYERTMVARAVSDSGMLRKNSVGFNAHILSFIQRLLVMKALVGGRFTTFLDSRFCDNTLGQGGIFASVVSEPAFYSELSF